MLKENEFAGDQDDKPQVNNNSKPIREGQPMGGQNFGHNNNTPAGDDKNNPSRSAGYSNAYFNRTEPSEEHPENSNFKPSYQDGEPDYNAAQPYAKASENMSTESQTALSHGYSEGTADNESADNDPDNMNYKTDTGDDML